MQEVGQTLFIVHVGCMSGYLLILVVHVNIIGLAFSSRDVHVAWLQCFVFVESSMRSISHALIGQKVKNEFIQKYIYFQYVFK